MPRVVIPPLMRDLTAGQACVTVAGRTVREVLDCLETAFPGTRERLLDKEGLRSDIWVAVDGEITPSGLLTEIAENSELSFVPAIEGG